MTSKKLGLAMVGCGDIAGAYHDAAQKAERAGIVMVSDINEELARKRSQDWNVPFSVKFDDVLANPAVNAVILSVPHFLHAPMTIRALEAGKHVMCDKPIATTVADAETMIRAAERTGRKLTINYANRFTNTIIYARELVRRGCLGELVALSDSCVGVKPEIYWQQGWAHVTSTDWRKSKVKAGGGITLMNCSHDIDALFHITGLSAVSVTGLAGTFNSPPDVEVEDLSSATFRLSNGGIMAVFASTCYWGGLPHHMSILGRTGQILMENLGVNKLRMFLKEDPGHLNVKLDEWVDFEVVPPDDKPGYARLMDGFAAAVFDGAPVPVDPREAAHTLATILAIFENAPGLVPAFGGAYA